MKRVPLQILVAIALACLCLALAVTTRLRVFGRPAWRAPIAASISSQTESTQGNPLRFSRDPEQLLKLWDRCRTPRGPDPFSDPPRSSGASNAVAAVSNLVLTAIWRQDEQAFAVINGRILRQDSEVASYRVTSIGRHCAVLTGPRGDLRLSFPVSRSETTATPPVPGWTRTDQSGPGVPSADAIP